MTQMPPNGAEDCVLNVMELSLGDFDGGLRFGDVFEVLRREKLKQA